MYNEHYNTIDAETGLSATAEVMMNMELYGATPMRGETDHRFMPDTDMIIGVIEEMFTSMAYVMQSTCLEHETDDLHWNIVTLFFALNLYPKK